MAVVLRLSHAFGMDGCRSHCPLCRIRSRACGYPPALASGRRIVAGDIAYRLSPTTMFTRPFMLLCLAMFLGYANQWVMTPAIPLYVHDMGGSASIAGLAL